MKALKGALILLIVAGLVFCFVGCSSIDPNPSNPGLKDDIKDIRFTISFDSQGGSEVTPITIKAGETIILPDDPTKEGYEFLGWYLDKELTNSFSISLKLDNDITLYAKWSEMKSSILPPDGSDSCSNGNHTLGDNCICESCGEEVHDLVYHEGLAPTCTEVGWDAYATCSRCDYTTYNEIPSLPHTISNCICSVCGEEVHNYVNGTCSDCGKSVYTRDGNYIYFGSYPQSEIIESSLKSVLTSNAGSLPTENNSANWTSYGYYIESTVTNYMWYIDVTHNNEQYRGVYFTSYRPFYADSSSSSDNTYQDDNGYSTSTVYWFKYEPIKWRILTESNGEALILCEMIIDSQEYYDNENDRTIDGTTVYANNYAHSNIRKWLNDNFYNTAFTSLQKEIILLTEVDNSARSTNPDNNATQWNSGNNNRACANTNDYIFLLSEQEVTKSAYGFSTDCTNYDTERQKKLTAYAQCQGSATEINSSYEGSGRWWLRSPNYKYSIFAHVVNGDGYAGNDSNVDYNARGGVVPALKIKLN